MATRRATGKALERALDCLPRVKLNNIADLPGAKKKASLFVLVGPLFFQGGGTNPRLRREPREGMCIRLQ